MKKICLTDGMKLDKTLSAKYFHITNLMIDYIIKEIWPLKLRKKRVIVKENPFHFEKKLLYKIFYFFIKLKISKCNFPVIHFQSLNFLFFF